MNAAAREAFGGDPAVASVAAGSVVLRTGGFLPLPPWGGRA
ncbi:MULTISPECIES: hypothetical protein [unclassified Streptomyces]|nr:hypothetical protein [Streptomyces sp. NRRL F-2747]